MPLYDFAVIGGGIVGLSIAMHLGERFPTSKIVILEKESRWGAHQTGHNSGVIHSGIYYKPGSLKATFCRDGCRSMVEFCQKHEIAHEICGKVIVATETAELPLLENLYRRGLQNGIPIAYLTGEEVREYEPHVRCLAGIRVRSTGIVDYRQVCLKYVEIARDRGSELYLNTQVDQIVETSSETVLATNRGEFQARFVINCAGLHSDRIAKLTGVSLQAKIVPFRGEYYELVPEKRSLVKGLIYPVPNPNFPFLGVHFTRAIDGSVHAGPNAVLSLKREGYRKTDFDLRDFTETITYRGFWRLAARHVQEGFKEVVRSVSKAAFVRSLQRLIPEVQPDDVIPTHAGVRAQALANEGTLVDDFWVVRERNSLHVCNAPSPAATSSLEIGKALVAQIPVPADRAMSVSDSQSRSL